MPQAFGADDHGDVAGGDRDVDGVDHDPVAVAEHDPVGPQVRAARWQLGSPVRGVHGGAGGLGDGGHVVLTRAGRRSSQSRYGRADQSGHGADGQFGAGRAGPPSREQVRGDDEQRAGGGAGRQRRAGGVRQAQRHLGRDQRDERDRPRRGRGHRGQRDRHAHQREAARRDPSAEPAGHVVAEPEQRQPARQRDGQRDEHQQGEPDRLHVLPAPAVEAAGEPDDGALGVGDLGPDQQERGEGGGAGRQPMPTSTRRAR